MNSSRFQLNTNMNRLLFLRATIIHPNGASFGYVHPQNVYSTPLMHGSHIGKINHFRCNQSR